MKIHTIQAKHGDCFIVEYGKTRKKKFILIDGGPQTVYKNYLRTNLEKIVKKKGYLDTVILSHVDQDHVFGLLDLMKELLTQKSKRKKQFIEIKELWHNSFDLTIDPKNNIGKKIISIYSSSKSKKSLYNTGLAAKSIPQGNKLKKYAEKLLIPSNTIFKKGIISVENHRKTITKQDIKITIVGPTNANFKELRDEWISWLKKLKKKPNSKKSKDFDDPDDSVPNLSSVMFLIKTGRKKILFTGDGRSDHLLQGLKSQKLLNSKGKIHVNLLKIPHHGSDRNVTVDFFKKVTADGYIISADGSNSNPDFPTLQAIVKSAKEDKRKIIIYLTNKTVSTRKLLRKFSQSKYGYKLKIMPKSKNSFTLELK